MADDRMELDDKRIEELRREYGDYDPDIKIGRIYGTCTIRELLALLSAPAPASPLPVPEEMLERRALSLSARPPTAAPGPVSPDRPPQVAELVKAARRARNVLWHYGSNDSSALNACADLDDALTAQGDGE